MDDQLTATIATVLGSSGAMGVILKVMLKKLSADWAEMGASIKALVAEVSTIKTKIAVHEALAEDNKRLRDDNEAMKRSIIVLEQQMSAVWKTLDRPRLSDAGR